MKRTEEQNRRLVELADEKNLTLEGFQTLTNTGLQSDLFEAAENGNLQGVDREEYRTLLGLSLTLFRIKMGGPENTDQIMAALGFSFHEWINQENFPLKPSENPWEDEIEIVDPGTSFTEEEGLQILKDKGLLRPTYEHGIRFGHQYGKTTTSEKKPFVIFLHEAWLGPRRYRRIVYLRRGPLRRKLDLDCPDVRFYGRCVLAGVRPRLPKADPPPEDKPSIA